MSLRDFLERFRPAGTPGASAAGVPVDRRAERASELEPTLAQLMDVQREAAWIRASADEAAEAVRRDAAREATELVAAARERAPEIRRQAAEPILQDARREADALRAAGDGAASVVRRRARKCMPDLVDHTVADALSLACGPGEGKAP
ncbi:hypothetical protein OIC43_04055 [Streptomyces sp. NBC_00825]|nr:hypothetical protein [Streptomyces sp. NBC_00892]WTB58835.1 hypothetical protein OG832_39655 [Streptomyces sp. NBC_00826]WTH88288.1 hypothetical protein OIC43_04055 [Streptomyces sp. NBC_00825]WTH97016.1 hypothetical protein OHA23_04055 [Streptomyces sp. NBC_00822]